MFLVAEEDEDDVDHGTLKEGAVVLTVVYISIKYLQIFVYYIEDCGNPGL